VSQACRFCGQTYSDEVKICQACGVDLLTGMHLSTRVTGPRMSSDSVDEDPADRPWWFFLLYIPAMFPGFKRPGVLLVSTILAVIGLAIMGMGLAFAAIGIVMAAFVICGIAVLAIAQAVAAMIVGETKLLPELLMDFDSNRWLCFITLMTAMFFGLFFGMKYVASTIQEPSPSPDELGPRDLESIDERFNLGQKSTAVLNISGRRFEGWIVLSPEGVETRHA
jgi:hypothetical protein